MFGLSKLTVWWMSLGIKLDRIDPACTYQNGGHERMHRDIKAAWQTTAASVITEERDCSLVIPLPVIMGVKENKDDIEIWFDDFLIGVLDKITGLIIYEKDSIKVQKAQ